jgi:hypothetical protein
VTFSEVINLVSSAGVAGLVLVFLMSGILFTKSHVDDLRETITEQRETIRLANERADAERRRADAAVEAAQTSNLLLAGIRKGISASD